MGKRIRRIRQILPCFKEDNTQSLQLNEKPKTRAGGDDVLDENDISIEVDCEIEVTQEVYDAKMEELNLQADAMFNRIKSSIDLLKNRLEVHDLEMNRAILSHCSLVNAASSSNTQVQRPQPMVVDKAWLDEMRRRLNGVESQMNSAKAHVTRSISSLLADSTADADLDFKLEDLDTAIPKAESTDTPDQPLPLQSISKTKFAAMVSEKFIGNRPNADLLTQSPIVQWAIENAIDKAIEEHIHEKATSDEDNLTEVGLGDDELKQRDAGQEAPNAIPEQRDIGNEIVKQKEVTKEHVNSKDDAGNTHKSSGTIASIENAIVEKVQNACGENIDTHVLPAQKVIGDTNAEKTDTNAEKTETPTAPVNGGDMIINACGEKQNAPNPPQSGFVFGGAAQITDELSRNNNHPGCEDEPDIDNSPVKIQFYERAAAMQSFPEKWDVDFYRLLWQAPSISDVYSRNNNHPGYEEDSDVDDSPVKIQLCERPAFVQSSPLKRDKGYFLFPIGSFTASPTVSQVVKWKDVTSIIPSGVRNHKNVDVKKFNRFEKQLNTISLGVPTSSYVRVKAYAVRKIRPPVVSMEALLEQNEKKRIFQETHAKFVCANLMMALRFLHEHDIALGSICPRTIILNDKGYPCMTGFHTAEVIHDRPSRPRGRINVEYSSSEQIYQDCISATTDIYSLGVLTYHMIYGRPPHRGQNITETRRNALNKEFVPAFEPEHISKEGRKFISKCLRKYEDRRFNILHKKAGLFESVSWFSGLNEEKLYRQSVPSPLMTFVSKGVRESL